MESPTDPPRFPLDIDIGAGEAVYRQIYRRIRAAILDGQLLPGARLPSWNALAAELSVARGTVKAAYDWLAGEGYVVALGPAGTRVNPALPEASRDPAPDAGHAALAGDGPADEAAGFPAAWGSAARPFQMGVPALDVFPRKLWSRLAARQATRLAPAGMVYQDPAGLPELRAAIAGYLAIARGISCTANDVLVTSGFAGAINMITGTLLAAGDRAWIEDPGYGRAREALRLAGATIVPVPVDGEGIDVAAGVRRAADARLAYVTPSHQSPLGMPLSLPRRLALLDWAGRQKSWIVEDDYYSEFRFANRPMSALKSLDGEGRVIYVGTFSKVLLPSLRLGYIVAPAAEADRFRHFAAYLMPSPSQLVQAIVADFIAQGHFGRHIRRMRAIYAARRAALVAALQEAFGDKIAIDLQDGGMHLVVHLPRGMVDVEIARRAAAAGLGPVPLSPWSLEARCGPGLLLSFANILPEDAPQAARRLQRIIRAD